MDTFTILKSKFSEIKLMGYTRAISNNKNASGPTLEKLLGSTGGDFNVPDFYDIEIKALRKYWDVQFDLFNCAPDGNIYNATKWLSDKFGYPDKNYKNIKVLKGDVYAYKLCRIGINYLFRTVIERDKKRIYLEVYNNNFRLISKDIYWDFDSLKEKLERKVNKLAIIHFNKKIINDNLFIHYNELHCYKLKNFDSFLKCFENRIIYLTFKTGVFKSGKYEGKFTNHGTSFRISKANIFYLFDSVAL